MLLYILDLCGVAVFASSGALAGVAAQLDLLGVLVLESIPTNAVYLLLRAAKAPIIGAFAAGFVTVAVTRLAAIAIELKLPVFTLPQ